jgi:hypothetical protein
VSARKPGEGDFNHNGFIGDANTTPGCGCLSGN